MTKSRKSFGGLRCRKFLSHAALLLCFADWFSAAKEAYVAGRFDEAEYRLIVAEFSDFPDCPETTGFDRDRAREARYWIEDQF